MEDKELGPRTREEVSDDGSAIATTPRKQGGVLNRLYPPGPQPGAKGRMKNHCRKFWWCDLLVFAIIVLIIVLPVIFVAIPKIAQRELNKSTLEVTQQDVLQTTNEGFHLKLVNVARSSSKYHPKIKGFQATLSLKDREPFLIIDIPETKSEKVTEIIVDQDVKFPSLDRFKEYNMAVMGSEEFEVYVDGKTELKQGGLQWMDVDYNKKVTMKGLNKLSGLSITDLRILSGRNEILPDGSNMIGTVHIPNPSVMTLELGNVTMNLAVAGTPIGYTLMPNLTLKPGDNVVSMQSRIDQIGVISMIRSNYTNGILPLEIQGNSSVRNGIHLEYFEAAIQHNIINLDLDAGPALARIGINVTDSE